MSGIGDSIIGKVGRPLAKATGFDILLGEDAGGILSKTPGKPPPPPKIPGLADTTSSVKSAQRRQRQKSRSTGRSGRDTILTSPSSSGPPTSGTNSLLGG